MKTNLINCIIIILLISASCSRKPVSNPIAINGISLKEVPAIDLTGILEDIRFIPLENNREGLFANADKIVVEKGRMYILDKTLKAVLCFDTTGKFIFRIQRVGKGPGEYTELNGMCILPEEEKMILHNRIPPKLLTYDLDGNYIKETRSQYGAYDIIDLGPNVIACFSFLRGFHGRDSIPTGIFLLKENGSFIDFVKDIGSYTSYYAVNYNSNLSDYPDGALVLSQSDTIYRLDSRGRVSVDFALDLGPWRMPDDLREISTMDPRHAEVFKGEYLQTKDQLVGFGPLRLFSFMRKNIQYFAFVNLKEAKGYYSTVIRNDLTPVPTMFPIEVSDRNELTGILDMNLIYAINDNLNTIEKELRADERFKMVSDFIKKAISNDQPVVYLARIKKQWITSK
jgi:hypothetical protein